MNTGYIFKKHLNSGLIKELNLKWIKLLEKSEQNWANYLRVCKNIKLYLCPSICKKITYKETEDLTVDKNIKVIIEMQPHSFVFWGMEETFLMVAQRLWLNEKFDAFGYMHIGYISNKTKTKQTHK